MLPPLVGVAVKVTEVPAQIAPGGLAVIFTAGVRIGFTNIIILLEVAVTGETQFALEVMITFTISPLTKVLLVYTGEFVPTFIPLTFH